MGRAGYDGLFVSNFRRFVWGDRLLRFGCELQKAGSISSDSMSTSNYARLEFRAPKIVSSCTITNLSMCLNEVERGCPRLTASYVFSRFFMGPMDRDNSFHGSKDKT